MATLDISDKFVAQCSPVIDSNYDTCGTITLASIDHLSVTDLNSLFQPGGLFADLDAWFFHSIEMKACGTRVYAWYDWIMANADRSMGSAAYKGALTGNKTMKGPGLLQPWVMGRQESVVNRDHWKMENSIRVADYTAGELAIDISDMTQGPLDATTGGTAVIRVSSRHGIPMDANWFRVGEVLHLFTLTDGVAQQGSWKVVDAAVDTALTYIDVLVTGENAASDEPYFNVATAGASDATGVIIPGINNVNDYERWCQNLPTVDPRKMVPFWYQTFRNARCVDAEYLAVFQRLMQSNEAFRQFGDLPLAERNRQDELEQQKRFVNAFFFQKPISTNQTLANWESLESINTVTEVGLTPGLGGKLKAKRANFIGVKEQLRVCDRVKDMAGNPLNLVEFLDMNRRIKRARESSGNRKVTRIDWHTNYAMKEYMFRAFSAYYKDLYDDQLRFVVDLGKTNDLGMPFDVYKVPNPAVEIAIIASEFFDDWYDEHDVLGIGVAANLMVCLDLGKPGPSGGTIYYSQLAANRKSYRTATIEELARYDSTFRCVMETTSQEQTLTSETGTVVVECPLNSLWIQNMALATPVVTGGDDDYSDLY